MKVLLFGLAAGAAVQAWRNFPADGPLTATSAMLLAGIAVLAAYLVGRGRRLRFGAVAVATAEANAEAHAVASNQVNVAVVVPGGGARPSGVTVPDADHTAWIEGPRHVAELDDLDGMDLSELVERHDYDYESEVDR